jgi:hypothetical protein
MLFAIVVIDRTVLAEEVEEKVSVTFQEYFPKI